MNHRLSAILLIGLSLRLAWALVQPATDAAIDALPDQREYLSLGRNLLQIGSLQFDDPRFHQKIFAYRLPGYPVFVAACAGSVRVVRVVQSLIGTATVLAVYGIAKRLGMSTAVADVAAGLVAINPFLIYFSGSILTETLFTAAVTWGVWSVVGRSNRSMSRFAGFGVCAIVATLLRPTAILLFPLIAFGAKGVFAKRLHRAVRTITVIVLTLFPWAARNHVTIGHWVWTTTNDGVTLYDGFHGTANGVATGGSDQRFFDAMPAERSMSEYDRSVSLARQARQWAIRHPADVVMLSVRKVLRGWSPVPLSHDFGRTVYRIAAAGYAIPFDVAIVVGLLSGRVSRSKKWLLVVPAIGVTLAQVLSVGSIRYRIPAEPVLAILAAVAWTAAPGRRMYP